MSILKTELPKNSLIFEYTNGYYIQCSNCSVNVKNKFHLIFKKKKK